MSDHCTYFSLSSICDEVLNPFKVIQLLYLEDFFENPEAIIRSAEHSMPLPQLRGILFDAVRERSLIHFATVLLRYDNPNAGKKLLDSGKLFDIRWKLYVSVSFFCKGQAMPD